MYLSIETIVGELAHSTLVSMDTIGEEYNHEELRKMLIENNQKSFLQILSMLSTNSRVIGSGLRIDFDKYLGRLYEIYSYERGKYPQTHSPEIQGRKYSFNLKELLADD